MERVEYKETKEKEVNGVWAVFFGVLMYVSIITACIKYIFFG